jgi:hypothetical protein
MKRLALMLISTSCFAMLRDAEIGIVDNEQTADEYFCHLAMIVYRKKTSIECSPELKPYILRTLNYSRHNGDSVKFDQIDKDLTREDEKFLMSQVNKAVASALKDQKNQIESRISKKNAALYIAVCGLCCTVITTAITLGSTLSGDCPK